MAVFLVERIEKHGYDTFYAMVVVADDAAQAVRLSVQRVEQDYWTPDKLFVTEIDPDGEPRVILEDYLEG